jgi:hypothetical protein
MDTVFLYADSKNRDANAYPTGSSYVLHLTNPIKNIAQVDLVSAKVPNTVYNLKDGTAALTVGSTVMNFKPGFFNSCALETEINNRLANQTSSVKWIPTEGKFLFQSSGSFSILVSNSISKLIGLPAGTHTGVAASTDPVYAQTLGSAYFIKSSTMADFSTNEYIFLDIQELRTPGMAAALSMRTDGSGTFSGGNARNSFAAIPMNVNSGGVKLFAEGADYSMKAEYPHPIDVVSRLTISWIDGSGQPIDFRGFDNNAFVLRFHQPKKEEPPPPPSVDMVELRRILEDMITIQKPKEPEVKRPLVGRWTLILLTFFAAAVYMIYNRLRPVTPLAPPVPQMRPTV